MKNPYVVGLDFGTDSVRTVIVDANNGKETASDVRYYTRWAKGMYCNPGENRFRQHPLDYLESLEISIIIETVFCHRRVELAGITDRYHRQTMFFCISDITRIEHQ